METEGDGTFCLQNAGVAEDVAAGWGEGENNDYKKKGWISVMGEMEDGTFYQVCHICATSEMKRMELMKIVRVRCDV